MVGIKHGVESVLIGVREIDKELGGGIPTGSLVFIEGHSKTGKSVLGQYLAYGALRSTCNSVAYYITDTSAKSLIAQMHSLSLYTLDDFLCDFLRVYPLYYLSGSKGARESLWSIIEHLSRLPERFKLAVVDSTTLPMTHIDPSTVLDFLQDCKELCDQGRSIVLLADSHAFKKGVLSRAYTLCDTYIRLRSEYQRLNPEQMLNRTIGILEVTKLHGIECRDREGIKFEIEPKIGIRILPFGEAVA